MDENSYHQLWINQVNPEAAPVSMAVQGGHYADCLAFVFVAGYQAAIRHCFTRVQSSGWVAFAVSEDRREINPLPGVTRVVDGGEMTLHGYKTWVAAVNKIDQLLISARDEQGSAYFLVPRTAPGLTLSVKAESPVGEDGVKKAPFLGEMSQGIAQFDHVSAPTPMDERDGWDVRNFGLLETLYIYIAFIEFVASAETKLRPLCESLLSRGTTLVSLPFQSAQELKELRTFDDDVQALLLQADELTSLNTRGIWRKDRRLISMYSAGIQAR